MSLSAVYWNPKSTKKGSRSRPSLRSLEFDSSGV
jgi:hypothetical protein